MAFDLGVSGYIAPKGAQTLPEQLLPSVITTVGDVVVPWSLDAALNYSAQLVNETDPAILNEQMNAMRDFMSLYAVTQSNTWGAMTAHVVNGTQARDALFGTGTQASGMITQVVIGGTGSTNPYPNMRKVLSGLGISNNYNAPGHQTHFHVFLNVPTPKAITGTGYLLTDNPADSVSSAVPQTDAQVLLDYTQSLITGEELMFTMDMPYVPPQETPIVLAQASAPAATPQPNYILNDCQETESTGNPRSAMRAVDPASMLSSYLYWHDKARVQSGVPIDLASIKNITLLQGTTHGNLVAGISNTGRVAYRYDPTPNYVGNDQAVFLAEFEGKVYKIVLELHVFETVFESDPNATTCPPPELIKVNGKPVSGSSGYDSGYSLNSLSVTFADLAGGAVGQTTGEGANAAITLDDNAAGYNWFIDTTPADNSEFLPTSNPNEWVAKAGSDAAGKMDMLSVLLHEYGHALGIEHSADSGDYMSTTLTPGVRRLPSATELALMQQLIRQAKDGLASASTPTPALPLQGGGGLPLDLPISLGGLAFAGLLRPNRYGSMNIDLVSAITPPPVPRPQYEVSANATFTSLNTASGWNTQGSVDIVSSTGTGQTGTATLNEVSTSQSRLSQVFMINSQDRYLSFTLSGLPLPNPLPGGEGANGALGASQTPNDAFEVALLDANTGLSVLGNDGLTHTDAFLNLQGDGTQNAASCVTCIVNADGSRTYRVDLTGVAKNKAVNLSFDLLGFGQSNSHVTLRDVRVSGLPQLHDEVASIAEDNLLTFNPFTQADAQLQPLLASHIVTAPTHGVLAMNTDGTFSYTPTLNFFGADSFSYRLSDGPPSTGSGQGYSNLATVSLTVTPVNDAPVAADAQVTTAEDTPLVITLGAYASDVDTPSLSGGGLGVGVGLTTAIVTGPAHGVLTQNADGTYNYTPVANYNGGDSFTYKVNDGLLDSNIATAMSTLK
jgi:hypothetical protein